MENARAKLSLSTELGKLLGSRGRGSPLSTDFRDNLHGAEVQSRILKCTPGVPEFGTLPPGARPKVSDPMTKTPVDSDKTESSVLSPAGSPRKNRDSPVVKGGDTLHDATGDENSPGPRLALVERDLSIFQNKLAGFETRFAGLDAHVMGVESRVENVNSEVKKVDNRVGYVDSTLKLLTTDVGGLKTEVSGFKGEIVQVHNNMQQVHANMQQVETHVQKVETRVQGVETQVQKVGVEVTHVQGDIQKMGDQVSHLGNEVATGMAGISDKFQGGLGSVMDKIEHLLGGGSTPQSNNPGASVGDTQGSGVGATPTPGPNVGVVPTQVPPTNDTSGYGSLGSGLGPGLVSGFSSLGNPLSHSTPMPSGQFSQPPPHF